MLKPKLKLLITLVILISSGSTMAQYSKKNFNLKSNVKEVNTRVDIKKNTSMPIQQTSTTKFDRKGRITEKTVGSEYHTYHYTNNLDTPDSITISRNNDEITIVAEFNKKGNKVREMKYINGEPKSLVEISFDSTINTEYKSVSEMPTNEVIELIVSTFDQDGCKIKECLYTYEKGQFYNSDPKLIASTSYIYDFNSKLIQHIKYTYNEEGVDTRQVAWYNKNEKISKEKSYTSDDFLFRKTTWKYDKYNNLKDRKVYFFDEDGKITTEEKYSYIYDIYQNWIEMYFFHDDELFSTTKREIIYWN